ncbi:MAG TPA: hypothetical protein P5191_00025 [Ruminococcus sp.]|nr:hypothetical protein [Ruminococcus sp.]
MNKDKTGKKKTSNITRIFILLFLFFIFSILVFGACIIDQIKTDSLKSINERAAYNYRFFNDNKEFVFNKLNIPDTGTYYITGEEQADYYLVYKNEFIDNDVSFSKDKNGVTGYWAIKVADNNVCEAWWSSHKLSEDELVPYDFKKQKRKQKFFDRSSDDNIVGYYETRLGIKK